MVTTPAYVFSIATMRTADSAPIGRVVLRGLDPAAVYDVSLLSPGEVIRGNNHRLPPWVSSGVRMTGATLQHAGLQLPDLFPEQLLRKGLVSEAELLAELMKK